MCRERKEEHGHEFLYGKDTIQGELLGGCLESLSEIITGERYADQKEIYKKYQIFPTREQWRDKIVFVETSEEKPNPKKLKEMLKVLEDKGVFSVARGLIIGKPQDEFYYDEYKEIYKDLAKKHNLPTVFNLNFGHTSPRIVLPYGKPIKINFNKREIMLVDGILGEKIYEKT